jgi:hypothetical protein
MPHQGHLPYWSYFWFGLAGGAMSPTLVLFYGVGPDIYFLTLLLSVFAGGGTGLLVGWVVKENCSPFRTSQSWRFLHNFSGILAGILGLIGGILIFFCFAVFFASRWSAGG